MKNTSKVDDNNKNQIVCVGLDHLDLPISPRALLLYGYMQKEAKKDHGLLGVSQKQLAAAVRVSARQIRKIRTFPDAFSIKYVRRKLYSVNQ